MKKCTLIWYYKSKIHKLEKRIESVRQVYAERSAMSSRNFEFDHLVTEDTEKYRKQIFRLKRKICIIKNINN